MIVSYNWLNSYFNNQLPKAAELGERVNMSLFEVEEITPVGNDFALDFKILPDRAGYAYAHRFLAQEIGALLGLPVTLPKYELPTLTDDIQVSVENGDLCPLYIGTKINGISNGPSPVWLKDTLTTVGQKSINFIVDLTNYVMLDSGQPLHAFDADKLSGAITVRYAKDGEKIELLDGRVVDLDSTVLVIADNDGPLALAGVKGGKKAEVTNDTKNIILEAASFDGTYVRKTSQKFNIKNDSTKRFENAVTIERPEHATAEFVSLLSKEESTVHILGTKIVGDKPLTEPKKLLVSVAYINERLGVEIESKRMVEILNSLDLHSSLTDTNTIEIEVPVYRNDITIPEDVVEEVGRVNGYDALTGKVPASDHPRTQLKSYVYSNKIRNALTALGFSEVYTYTLKEEGDYALANPLNNERSHLRNKIGEIFPSVLEKNLTHLDLLGIDKVCIFEIGKVFKDKVERLSLAVGALTKEQKTKSLIIQHSVESAIEALCVVFGIDYNRFPKSLIAEGVIEIDLEMLIAGAPDVNEDIRTEPLPIVDGLRYKKFSPYPYMVRDIAVFIPGPTGKAKELRSIIESVNSPLIVALRQFDEFEKKNKETGEVEKTSYAFRMVFQSYEKTLTDEEVQVVMNQITEKIGAESGFEIR